MIKSYQIFARQIGLVAVAQLMVSLEGLIILPILTKTLGASAYGIWALILATVSFLQPFILLGLDSSILRFLSSKDKKEIVQGVITVLFVVVVLGLIVSSIIFFSSDFLFKTFLKDESVFSIIKLAIPLVILTPLNTIVLGSFRVFGLIKRFSAIVLFKTFFELGLISFFVLSGYGLQGAILALLITTVISLFIMLIIIISYAGISTPKFSILPPYIAFGFPLIPILLSQFVMAVSDRYVIGFFLGSEQVGIYSAAYAIGSIPLMFSTYILYVLQPTAYRLYDTGRIDEVKVYLSYSWKYFLMLSIPAVFGLSVLATPLLVNITTVKFVFEGMFIIPLVALSMVFLGMQQIFGLVLLLDKRRKIFVIVFAFASIMNLGLNIIFVPYWGIIAAAVTTLFAYIVAASMIFYKSRRFLKFDIRLVFVIKCILASIVMTSIIFILSPTSVFMMVVSIGIGVVIYFSLLFLLKGFEKNELKAISEVMGLRKLYKKRL
jgi:O-antigen/teichoic acid export membrane protein